MSIDSKYYTHRSDTAALKALKAIPGFHQFIKGFMKVWSERQYHIINMSTRIKISSQQLPQYYNMLPPICEKLGIALPELYLELDVSPNSYTSGDTNPFIVITSGLLETIPEDLIPTVLAHECGHIACHHVLYSTIGQILLNGAGHALNLIPYGGLASIPLEIAFFYWMRCSELSADRAAVLCDGTAEKMSDVCMRLAGYDKDIQHLADKELFLEQARMYKEMIRTSKWDRTLEFLTLMHETHPLTAVRALECEEWVKTEQYQTIIDGTYQLENSSSELDIDNGNDEIEESMKVNRLFELPLLKKKSKEKQSEIFESEISVSIPDEIKKYKSLLDDGIITEEEFSKKKKQLLGL